MFAEDEIVGPVRKLARHNKTVFLFEKNKKKTSANNRMFVQRQKSGRQNETMKRNQREQ